MSTERRVVITGLGLVTPLGNDIPTFWSNIKSGVSGIGKTTLFDPAQFDCKISGEVRDFEAVKYFKNAKDVRRTDRYAHFSMAAAKLAFADGNLDPATLTEADRERFGCIIGSGIGGLKSLSEQHTVLMNKGPDRISPFMIPMMISNMASGFVSMEFGLQGPNFATVSACATACHAIGEAWRMIKYNEADAFVAGGAEAPIVPLGVAGFAAMKALSTRNDDPTRASRPFDKDRDAFRNERRRERGPHGRNFRARQAPRRADLLRSRRLWPDRRRLSHDLAAARGRRGDPLHAHGAGESRHQSR